MSGECDRARQWASTEVDGELSSFERVLLHAHLDACPSCSEFSSTISGLTAALREARLAQLERPIVIGRLRRRARLRLAPAVAAMAVAAVGLGSFLATSMRSGSVAPLHTNIPVQAAVGPFASLDTMDLRTSQALERLNAFQQASSSAAARSLRGGPALRR
jgi:predicted anti-sigma-YlaC factor YlaD